MSRRFFAIEAFIDTQERAEPDPDGASFITIRIRDLISGKTKKTRTYRVCPNKPSQMFQDILPSMHFVVDEWLKAVIMEMRMRKVVKTYIKLRCGECWDWRMLPEEQPEPEEEDDNEEDGEEEDDEDDGDTGLEDNDDDDDEDNEFDGDGEEDDEFDDEDGEGGDDDSTDGDATGADDD